MTDILHIVCSQCSSINRLPRMKLADHPVCGKCKQPIFKGVPIELTAFNFHKHISHDHIPVLIDFWAAWCGPCKIMAPVFEQAASRLEPYVRVAKLDTEREQGVAAQYNIRSIPTMIIFKNGREVARQSGAVDLNSLIQWVKISVSIQ
ncbi:MAG: thioredoxin TrxC [Nitrospiraceae bacterium]|nr:MAG: thioredoxin TrxC [Nitrospiraceae bacterium]